MSAIEWKPFYSINVEKIDNQHRNLVDMINRLAGSVHKGIVNEEIGKVLTELVDYTKEHFADEEKLMEEINYSALSAQQKMHREFVDQIVAKLKRLKAGHKVDVFEMIKFLSDWLVNHIVEEDMKIGKAIQARKAQTSVK